MTYATPRSMNADLEEGMTDGKYKKVVQNRGGLTEKEIFYQGRSQLNDFWYGIHEDQVKYMPDGTVAKETPEFVPNLPPQHIATPNAFG